MFRTNRLAARAAGTAACVYDAEPPPELVTLAPKRRRKKPPEPEPSPAPEAERC